MNLIILGKRSLLTKSILSQKKNTIVIQNSQIDKNKIFEKIDKKKKYSIIINSFYPSAKLNNFRNYEDFYQNSLLSLSKF